MNKCEYDHGVGRCQSPATCRVRLWDWNVVEGKNEPTEMDLCEVHSDEAAGEYPDNIELVTEYDEPNDA